jgi:hypothetical protein
MRQQRNISFAVDPQVREFEKRSPYTDLSPQAPVALFADVASPGPPPAAIVPMDIAGRAGPASTPLASPFPSVAGATPSGAGMSPFGGCVASPPLPLSL